MNIICNVDASWDLRRSYAGWAFHVFRGNILHRASGTIDIECRSPLEAELMAIGHACNFIQSIYRPGDNVVVYTDCLPARNYLSRRHTLNRRCVALANTITDIMEPIVWELRQADPNNKALHWCDWASKSYNEKRNALQQR